MLGKSNNPTNVNAACPHSNGQASSQYEKRFHDALLGDLKRRDHRRQERRRGKVFLGDLFCVLQLLVKDFDCDWEQLEM